MNYDKIIEKEYGLNWIGKQYAKILAELSTTTSIYPDENHNQKIENISAENILIKGDNLDVLKHLLVEYKEKIKMIYIDPPYNTGNQFTYNDRIKFVLEELQKITGIEDTKILKRIALSKIGRHSAWLTFMYPRLYIAKQLLRDDGVIFVSIDDNEVHHLRMIMDEIFEEENFVTNFIWEKTQHFVRQKINYYSNADYILCYAKTLKFDGQNLKEVLVENVQTEFADAPLYNAFTDENQFIFKAGSVKFTNIHNSCYKKTTDEKYKLIDSVSIKNGYNENNLNLSFRSRWSQKKIDEEIEKGTKFLVKSTNFAIRAVYNKDKFFKNSSKQIIFTNINNPLHIKDRFGKKVGVNKNGSDEVKKIFNNKNVYDYPKPVSLIRYLTSLLWDCRTEKFSNNFFILDFFAGSGTTGDAVMQLNAEDGGNRKFILVQLPEPIDPKKNKTAYDFVKDELKAEPTIFEITKERLLRAAKKINAELDTKIEKLKQELPTDENKLEIEKYIRLKKQNAFKIYECK